MADFSALVESPRGIIRCLLSLALTLGCVGATPGLNLVYALSHNGIVRTFDLPRMLEIDVATGGGALVALALLFNGAQSEGKDAQFAELIFSGVYMVLDLVAFFLVLDMVSNNDFSGNAGIYILLVCLVIAFILWLLDFILCIRDVFK